MERGKIVIFSGPSGSGKGTIKGEFFKNKKLNLIYSISATSRAKRTNEVDGKDYFFLNKEDFKTQISNNKFIEWAKFANNYYGTPQDYVEKQLNKGKNVLLEIEIKGVKQIIKKYPDALKLFLIPPSMEELKNRLQKRSTETKSTLKKRLKRAKKELKYQKLFDYVFVNDDIKIVTKKIIEVLERELNKDE